jgi:hypothetical protein
MSESSPHLVVLHSAVRGLRRYDPAEAPAIGLEGPVFDRRSQIARATMALVEARGDGTLGGEIAIGVRALRAAGVPRRYAKRAGRMAEEYFFGELGMSSRTPTREPKCRIGVHV